MALKIGKLLTHAVIIGLLVTIVVLLVQGRGSGYSAAPLTVVPGPDASSLPQSLYEIPSSLECTPGPSENASYYSRGLTPGGLCGDGDAVRSQLRDYNIDGGIGGSLLERS
jgi:hypothetical protein